MRAGLSECGVWCEQGALLAISGGRAEQTLREAGAVRSPAEGAGGGDAVRVGRSVRERRVWGGGAVGVAACEGPECDGARVRGAEGEAAVSVVAAVPVFADAREGRRDGRDGVGHDAQQRDVVSELW